MPSFWAGYAERRALRAGADTARWEIRADRDARMAEPSAAVEALDVAAGVGDNAGGAAKGAIIVFDFVGNRVGDLIEFAAGLFDGGDTAPRSQAEQYRAQRRAAAAMDSMADDIRNGRGVQESDVRSLSHAQLDSIRNSGRETLGEEILQRIDRDRERGRAWER